jgi:hypothetical protein
MSDTPDAYEDNPNNDDLEPILMETAAIVERANQAVKSERWLKRIERSLRRLGVTSIVGRDFVYLDEETAEVRFGKVPLHRLSMFCNRLEDLAVLADDYPTRVPAPMVGGTNVWIETLHVQLNIFDTPDPTHD